MHRSRLNVHNEFKKFTNNLFPLNKHIKVIEIGCGKNFFYKNFFKNSEYTGIDISKNNIDWCNLNNNNKNHKYKHLDFLEKNLSERFDLVYSHGTIDHAYNINKFLSNCIKISKSYVYITACRGWFDDISNHKYSWSDKNKIFYNDISIIEVRNFLSSYKNIKLKIEKQKTNKKDIPYETKILIKKTS